MGTKKSILAMVGLVLFMFSLADATTERNTAWKVRGRVIDIDTGQPIKDALVTVGTTVTLTDENGAFSAEGEADAIGFRAHGYGRSFVPVPPSDGAPLEVRLKPVRPKALYLTSYGIGDRSLRGNALRLIKETEINALVIDVKGDRGMIMHKSDVPLAAEIGAQKLVIMKDMRGQIAALKEQGIYTIARIVVFKDNVLGAARPDLAMKTRQGEVWRDREGLVWVDASKKEVWDYNIAIAEEAARIGFDEVQFDYVRFPDVKGPVFGFENTETNRVNAIAGFLQEARRRLTPYNVFLSADIFGYVAWNLNDTMIGQRLDSMAASVDYLALMLYPSGFQFGIPGYTNPVEHPAEIISLSLERARQRTGIPAVRFRPWLQGFRDYAFDKRNFSGPEIRAQIAAAESFGAGGWMLWNPRNVYLAEGLNTDTAGKIVLARLETHPQDAPVDRTSKTSYPMSGQTLQRTGLPDVSFSPWLQEFKSAASAPGNADGSELQARITPVDWMVGSVKNMHLPQGRDNNKPTVIIAAHLETRAQRDPAGRSKVSSRRRGQQAQQAAADISFSPSMQGFGDYASEPQHFAKPKKQARIEIATSPETEGWMPWNSNDMRLQQSPNHDKPKTII